MSDDGKIFEYFFVARRVEPTGGEARFHVDVIDCYPKSSDELIKEHPKVDIFCFPEASKEVVRRSRRFAFTLTDASGKWLYGFCIRAERKSRIPDCLCILSKYPYFDMFYEVLCYDQLQYNSGYKPTVARTLHSLPFPPPGSRFSISTPNHRFYVTRPSDVYPLTDANIQDLYNTFGAQTMMDLLLSILEEQRVLITGDDLDLVTGCIHALTALLFPFEWSYPFVPVLPPSMLDAICSPTPFIMGIHSEVLKQASRLPTENIVLADTRNGSITGLKERNRLAFPNSKLKDKMKEIMEKKGKSKVERTHEAITVMAEFFAGIFGKLRGYPTVVQTKKGEELSDFDDELFLNCFIADKRMFPFVLAMTKTLMYQTLKEQSDNWTAGKPDTFAEKCAMKYPDLWEPYASGKDLAPAKRETTQGGFLARFGRAKEKVRKEIDKKMKKNASSQVASPVSSGGDRASSPERPSGASSSPASAWLTESTDTNKTLIDGQYGDFPALHESLDPFVVHGGNVYEPPNAVSHIDPFDSLGAIAAAPSQALSPRSVIKEITVTKINGRVGCSYYRNEVAKVDRSGAAYKAGVLPGCKMLALDGAIMEGKESHEVKAMLDSAPQQFVLTVMMPVPRKGGGQEEGKEPEEKTEEAEVAAVEKPATPSLEDIFAAPVTGDDKPPSDAAPKSPPAGTDDEFPF